jgi:uncharacterized membrane protein YdjX (TVP38/TMEM64 family)
MGSIATHVPWLGQILPWGLVSGFGKTAPLIAYLVMGQPLATVTPIVATVAWCAVFLIAAVWRLRREDF